MSTRQGQSVNAPMVPVLFENDDLIAVDKPAGLASIPAGAADQDNLLAILAPAFPAKLYVVHRLDKEVSGVILFAKHAAAHRFLNEQFNNRTVEKRYAALVHGAIVDESGRIDLPLRPFGSGRMGVDVQRGKASVTEFQIRERLAEHTLVEVRPLSGRRHQIRVHFYSIGHPVVGDRRYGDRAAQRAFPRLMLHAQSLAVPLPTGERVVITAPLPESFSVVIEACRKADSGRFHTC